MSQGYHHTNRKYMNRLTWSKSTTKLVATKNKWTNHKGSPKIKVLTKGKHYNIVTKSVTKFILVKEVLLDNSRVYRLKRGEIHKYFTTESEFRNTKINSIIN